MLTMEIKVNGNMIGYISAVNKGSYLPHTPGVSYEPQMGYHKDEDHKEDDLYECNLYELDKAKVKSFKVFHNREDGWEILVKKVMEKGIE